MAETFNIFYSWQLDTNPDYNKYFIESCLIKAIKQIKKDNSINVIPRLDKDTEKRTGSPDIVDSILKKIDSCNIFIADVTIINFSLLNKLLKNKPTPNPNVLIEMGYAVNRLSWDRIICLNNSAFSDINKMPFDIRQNRISQYACDKSDNKVQIEKLVALLTKAIKSIIENYDAIISKEQQGNYTYHDKLIFKNFNAIVSESVLIQVFENIAENFIIDEEEYKFMMDIYYYLKNTENHFLIKELNTTAQALLGSIIETKSIFAMYSGYETKEYFDEELKKKVKRSFYTLKPDRMAFFKDYDTEHYKRAHEISGGVDKVINAYKIFRRSIKEKLYI